MLVPLNYRPIQAHSPGEVPPVTGPHQPRSNADSCSPTEFSKVSTITSRKKGQVFGLESDGASYNNRGFPEKSINFFLN